MIILYQLFTASCATLFLGLVNGQQEMAAGCGTAGKHCLGRPVDCLTTDPKTCEQLATVTPATVGHTRVEIWGKNPTMKNRWIGLAFSEDENMGKDAVVHCINNDTITTAELTFNADHFNLQPGISQKPIHPSEQKLEDDGLHCTVELDKKFTIKDLEFDLATPHHLLFTSGPVKAGRISKHDKIPIVSAEAFTF